MLTQLSLLPKIVPDNEIIDIIDVIKTRKLPNKPVVVSYGGGINSTALIIWARLKKIKIDKIIFADTGNEKPETYEFLSFFDKWLQTPWQNRPPMPGLTVVRYQPKKTGDRKKTRKLFRFTGKVSLLALPWFVFEQTIKQTFIPKTLGEQCLIFEDMPSKAYGYGACSAKWKISAIHKYIKDSYSHDIIQWIGIHSGEAKYRLYDKKGQQRPLTSELGIIDYPLIREELDQSDCVALCRLLPVMPIKSSCWFCPNAKISEVKKLKKKHPELYKIGCFMEHQNNQIAPANSSIKGLGRSFAWKSIDNISPEQELQLDMFSLTKKCSCVD